MIHENEEPSILVVDDNPSNCDLLSRRLTRKGFKCGVANSGQKALDQVQQCVPDMILLDVMMPGMDGLEVLTRLRQKYNSVELPILMVTAKNANDDIISAFEKGANDYIEKPVEFAVMLARIRHHLQHKRLDDELKRSQHKLLEHNILLNTANQHKINFISSMSHELRTPLNAILGFSEVLIDGMAGDLNEKQKEYCKEIYDSGSFLLIIINDLLDLSKLEAGKLRLDRQNTDVEMLVQHMIGMVKAIADLHQVKINVDIQQNLGSGNLDAVRVKQILINLLVNAIKFTDSGKEVVLHILKDEQQHLVIQVIDQGCGISTQDLKLVFLPFEQAESSLQGKKVEGTGLGLALVKKLAELHGGSVTAHSELGRGSCFTVILPFLPVE